MNPNEQPVCCDEERFRAVFAATYDDVVRLVRRRTHAHHAEDVATEAFATAWRRGADLPLVASRDCMITGVVGIMLKVDNQRDVGSAGSRRSPRGPQPRRTPTEPNARRQCSRRCLTHQGPR